MLTVMGQFFCDKEHISAMQAKKDCSTSFTDGSHCVIANLFV
jgi:hypothetical protein